MGGKERFLERLKRSREEVGRRLKGARGKELAVLNQRVSDLDSEIETAGKMPVSEKPGDGVVGEASKRAAGGGKL